MKRTSKINKSFRRKAIIYTVLLSAMALDLGIVFYYIKHQSKEELFVSENIEPNVSYKSDLTPDAKNINTVVPIETESIPATDINPLFVGDSRTVGLKSAVNNISVLADNGRKYDYFISLDSKIRSTQSDCLVIGFGVNDLEDINKYIDYADKLADELKIPVFFLTVNPTDKNHEKKNEEINDFNDALIENAGKYIVIDTNSYLKNSGFTTVDGLHYDDKTYINIYRFIMETLLETGDFND